MSECFNDLTINEKPRFNEFLLKAFKRLQNDKPITSFQAMKRDCANLVKFSLANSMHPGRLFQMEQKEMVLAQQSRSGLQLSTYPGINLDTQLNVQDGSPTTNTSLGSSFLDIHQLAINRTPTTQPVLTCLPRVLRISRVWNEALQICLVQQSTRYGLTQWWTTMCPV